jgi:hypothetical protein
LKALLFSFVGFFLNFVANSDLFMRAFLTALVTYGLLFASKVFFVSDACLSSTLLKVVSKLNRSSQYFDVLILGLL